MEYVTRGVCGQEGCRERRYYLDSGLWFCRRGHQQEGQQVEEDPEDFGTQGKTNRLKKAVVEKGQRTYQGRQAYTLFLQVYQLILWKQCYALVNDHGFPAQLEDVVRGLWALRLETFSQKINGIGEGDEEPELFSSQPTGLDENDETSKPASRQLEWPRLIDSVALCYLGCLLLRLPVFVGDLHRMVIRGEIPFIRIIKSIPREMRDKLPQTYISLLETKSIPKAENLHKASLELAIRYSREFGVTFPALNSPLILLPYIKRLALPVEIYPAVKRLQDLVGYNYSFPKSIKGKRQHVHIPEIQLIALLVISTKLLFPFDDVKRYPHSLKEPASQVIDWDLWAQAQRQFDNIETAGGRIGKGNEIRVREKDVLGMTSSQLDEYMDWYESSWVDLSKAPNPLSDMFPSGRVGLESQQDTPSPDINVEQALATKLQAVMGQLKMRRVISDESASYLENDVSRPGSFYQRYRTGSDLPEKARPFFETAANLAGITLHTLIRAVFQTELKMAQWQDTKRRVEYHEELSDMDFSMDTSDEEMVRAENA